MILFSFLAVSDTKKQKRAHKKAQAQISAILDPLQSTDIPQVNK